jgi:hypothetical protein
LIIVLLIIVYVVIAIFQINSLINRKYWRDLCAFGFFMLNSFILSLLYLLDIKITDPGIVIEHFLDILHLHY